MADWMQGWMMASVLVPAVLLVLALAVLVLLNVLEPDSARQVPKDCERLGAGVGRC
jgi:cytochrome c oxidase assembly factor CtaG